MSSERDQDFPDSESREQLSARENEDLEDAERTDDAEEVEGRLVQEFVHNPQLLQRVLAKPELISIVQHMSIFSGPIPSSDEFANYEKTLPGAADRIAHFMAL